LNLLIAFRMPLTAAQDHPDRMSLGNLSKRYSNHRLASTHSTIPNRGVANTGMRSSLQTRYSADEIVQPLTYTLALAQCMPARRQRATQGP